MIEQIGNAVLRACLPAWVNRFGLAVVVITLVVTALSAQASPRVRQENLMSRDGRAQFAIDAGELHTCAVRNDGTVRCWGYNADGQLGDNSNTDRLIPVIRPSHSGGAWIETRFQIVRCAAALTSPLAFRGGVD